MSEAWYYGSAKGPQGPISLTELVQLLERITEPRRVLVWRDGFEDWKPVAEVRDVLDRLYGSQPLPGASPVPVIREPAVTVEEAAEFKGVQPQPHGIGGWLVLVAIGQVVGPLRLVAEVARYVHSINGDAWKRFPVAFNGELTMNLAMIVLSVSTTILFFTRSRRFPRFFVVQMACIPLLPIFDMLWIALIFSVSLNRSPFVFLKIDFQSGLQVATQVIAAAIWIPYVLRSRRVANTFVK